MNNMLTLLTLMCISHELHLVTKRVTAPFDTIDETRVESECKLTGVQDDI